MTKYLGNDKYLKRLHGLIVRFGEHATVESITPLTARGIVMGADNADRLRRGARQFLFDTVRRSNAVHTTGLVHNLRDCGRNDRQGDKEQNK